MERLYELLNLLNQKRYDEYKAKLKNLTREEQILLDLHLRKAAQEEKLMGVPSIDKTWLRYYSEENIKAEIPEMSAYEYLKKRNEDNLDLIAIDSVEGLLTYEELFREIDKTAASLQKLGTTEGKIILGMLPAKTVHEVLLLYAVSKIGAAISTYPNVMIVEDICKSINEFNTEYFFIFDEYLTPEMEDAIYKNTKLKSIVVVSLNPNYEPRNLKTMKWNDFIKYGENYEWVDAKTNPKGMLFMAKTGGSTGKPKSVMLSNNSFNKKVHELIQSSLNYNKGDRWLRLWPLFSASAAVTGNHISLCCGMRCILRDAPQTQEEWENMLIEERPDHLVLIPSQLEGMEQSQRLKSEHLRSIKTFGVGGMIINEALENRVKDFAKRNDMNVYLGIGYGQTENGPTISIRMSEETAEVGYVGAPLVNTVVGIFDPETGEELGYNQEGEICVKSDSKMIGYYNDSEKTNEVLKVHRDGVVWLHTKDLGMVSEKGLLKVTGRMTRFVFTYPALQKAYPDQVESIISNIPGVIACAIGTLPYEDTENFKYLISFIVVDPEYNPDDVVDMINAVCKQYLPEYAIPSKFYVREFFPLLPSGKPDVGALEDEVKNTYGLLRTKKA